MTTLLLLLALAGIALYFLQPAASYRKIAGGVGIASSLLLLGMRLFGGGPESIDYLERFDEAIGQQMAVALKERVPETGTVIVLPLNPEAEKMRKRHDALIGAFLKELEGSDWEPVISQQSNLPAQIAPFGAAPNLFASEMSKYPNAEAVVSFIGLPIMNPEQWPTMPLLVQDFRMDRRVRSWQQQPSAKAIITLQEEFDGSARPKGRDLKAIFDLRYQITRP